MGKKERFVKVIDVIVVCELKVLIKNINIENSIEIQRI